MIRPALDARFALPKLARELPRFAKFFAVGASGILVNQFTLWFAREHLFAGIDSAGLRLNLALAVAISLATLNNFLWNRSWTWRDRHRVTGVAGLVRQFGQYCAAVALGIILQALFTNLLVSFLDYMLANLCAIAIGSAANFAINHLWTFGSAAHPTRLSRESLILGCALLVAAFTYFYGLGSADIPANGDENVYIHIARKTAESGHWLPLAGDLSHLRNTKPPLLFWQAIAATGHGARWTLWRLRAPSVLYCLATATLVLALVRHLRRDWGSAARAALVYLAFYSTYRYGRPFLTDAPMVFWMTLPFIAIVWSSGRLLDSRYLVPVSFGLALGIACLYKSFVLVVPFTLATVWWQLERREYRLRESLLRAVPPLLLSCAVALAVFAVWPLADPDPGSVWRDFVLRENAGKLGAGGGSYLGTLLWGEWSIWSLLGALLANGGVLAPILLVLLLDGWRRRRSLSREERLLWIWVLALFVAFAIPSQRSGRYLLPAMPALASLAALAWPRLHRSGFAASVVVSTLLSIVLLMAGAALISDAREDFELAWAYWLVLGCAAAFGVLSLALPRLAPAAAPALALALLLAMGIFVRSVCDPAGPFTAAARAQLSGKVVFVPCNFPSSEEGHRFLLPGADIRSYAENERQTPATLAEHYRYFAAWLPLGEAGACSGCKVIGERYVVRGRHASAVLREETVRLAFRGLVEREVLFESSRAPSDSPPPFEACAK
jgi:4-amino-4-deoxy-L-arabinose transferase-like glycosyltransferase